MARRRYPTRHPSEAVALLVTSHGLGSGLLPVAVGAGGDKATLVQVGWRSKGTGEICDCPVYETSPHAASEPVYVIRYEENTAPA